MALTVEATSNAAPGPVTADERTAAVVVAGLRRISGQRIVLGEHGTTCTVYGLVNRLPTSRTVSLGTALALRQRRHPHRRGAGALI